VKIVPAFDIETRTWYVVEPAGIRAEASTLRELKGRIGGRVAIEGYYPNGYSVAEAQARMAGTPLQGLRRTAVSRAAEPTALGLFEPVATSPQVSELHERMRAAGQVL